MANKSQLHTRADEGAEDPRAPRRSEPNVVRIDAHKDNDPLQSFRPEASASGWRALSANRRTLTMVVAGAVLIIGLSAAAAALYLGNTTSTVNSAAIRPLTGHVLLNSRPEGVIVSVDGTGRGVTPVELDLPAGAHGVVFADGASERRLTVNVEAGARISENVDVPGAARQSGQIEVTSDPPGARVSLDGKPAGVTPLTIPNVSAARHAVVLTQGETVVNRSVDVSSGATASVFVALARGRERAGWFALETPVELRILENGELLGLSGGLPLMLPAGRHQVDLVNDSVEIHLSRTLTIEPGKSTRVSVPLPNGTLSVNASPWAEVFVDGRSIGTTPLGSIPLAVGSHELVARHPQLGEKRRTIVVGARTPLRVSMDLSR